MKKKPTKKKLEAIFGTKIKVKDTEIVKKVPSLWKHLCRTMGCYLYQHDLTRVTIELHGTEMKVTTEPK